MWFKFCCLHHLNLVTGKWDQTNDFLPSLSFSTTPTASKCKVHIPMGSWRGSEQSHLPLGKWLVHMEIISALGNWKKKFFWLQKMLFVGPASMSPKQLSQSTSALRLYSPMLAKSYSLWSMRGNAKSARGGLSVTSFTHRVQGETKALMFHRLHRIFRAGSLPLSKALKCKLSP